MDRLTTPPTSPNVSAMDRPIARKAWRRYLPWAAGAGVLLAAAIAYVVLAPGAGARTVKAADLTVSTVTREPFHDFVPARGEVAPRETVYVDAVEGGQVARLVAQDGDTVAVGALLAVLSNPQLEREVGAREADITGRISDVRGQLLQLQRSRADREREADQARYELIQAERNLSTRRTLHAKSIVSDAELSSVTDEAAFRRKRLSALEAALGQERSMVARQSVEIERTLRELQGNLVSVSRSLDALNLRAPVAGRLTAFDLQPGQTVQAGARVGQVDTEGAYKLIGQIDEFYLGRVSLGQTATARQDGRAFAMKVSRIFPQVQNGAFRIELAFDGAQPPAMRRGQTLDVEVTLGDTRPAVVLPNGPFLEATGGTWIFVLDRSGRRAERRAIRTGRRNPQAVEVTSGLNPGERVITSAYDGIAKQTRLILR